MLIKGSLQTGFSKDTNTRRWLGLIIAIILILAGRLYWVLNSGLNSTDLVTLIVAGVDAFVFVFTVFSFGFQVYGKIYDAILNLAGIVSTAVAVSPSNSRTKWSTLAGGAFYTIETYLLTRDNDWDFDSLVRTVLINETRRKFKIPFSSFVGIPLVSASIALTFCGDLKVAALLLGLAIGTHLAIVARAAESHEPRYPIGG